MTIRTLLSVILLIFLSLVPRSVEVLSGNYLFGFDQGRDYLAVKNIDVDKKLTLIGSEIGAGSAGFRGIFHGPLHYYLLALPFLIFNGDPYWGVFLTFFYGITTIILSFYIGKKIFGLYGGIIVGLIVAISPPLISQSRFVWNSHGVPVFVLLAFYFTYKLTKEIKYRHLFFAAFFSALIYNFQLAIAIPIAITLLAFISIVLRLKNIKNYFFLFSGFVVGFFPMILFEMRHGFMAMKEIIMYIFQNKQEVYTSFLWIAKDHFGTFIYNFLDTFPHLPIITNKILIAISLLLFCYLLLKEKNIYLKRFFIYLLLLPLVTYLVFLFLNNAVYVYYLLHLNLVYILFISYLFYSSIRYKNYFLQIGIILVLSLYVVKGLDSGIRTFRYDFVDYGGTAKIKGAIEAVDTIYKDANGKPFGLIVFTPPVYTYVSDYLIWWLGKQKYNYIPYSEKKGIFYLLMEPDP